MASDCSLRRRAKARNCSRALRAAGRIRRAPVDRPGRSHRLGKGRHESAGEAHEAADLRGSGCNGSTESSERTESPLFGRGYPPTLAVQDDQPRRLGIFASDETQALSAGVDAIGESGEKDGARTVDAVELPQVEVDFCTPFEIACERLQLSFDGGRIRQVKIPIGGSSDHGFRLVQRRPDRDCLGW